MDAAWLAGFAGLLGIVAGVGITLLALRRRDRSADPVDVTRETLTTSTEIDADIADLLAVLRSSAMILDEADAVVVASPAAEAVGLVRDQDVVHPELRHLVRRVRRDGAIREVDLDLARGPLGEGTMSVRTRIAPLGSRHVLLLVDDHTQAKRVEEVRRDFVANVSHELKTPVGGIALLAEAVLDASEDPEAVTRFARRIKIESNRLTRLVQEIVDLSRLQASESLSDPVPVDVAEIVGESIEHTQVVAESRDIAFTTALAPGSVVYGDAQLLRTAVSNLLTNAVNYSPDGTRVAITVQEAGGLVEIAVADQGCGISPADQERIFERFYRVDAARSRATGGTGLGLAIVKHITTNHGGEIRVWSSLGHGSTFTIRLPSAARRPGERAPSAAAGAARRPAPTPTPAPAVQQNATREVTR